MADAPIEQIAPAPAAAPGPVPAPAPEPVAASAPAPAAQLPEAPKPAEGAQPAADAGFKPHTDEPTLLEKAGKPPEGDKKPDDPKAEAKPGEEKPGEAKAPGAEAPQINTVADFQPYTAPEGVKLPDETIGKFNSLLIDAALNPQTRGQALLDLHFAEMTNLAAKSVEQQHRVFGDMRKDWRTRVKADEEIGGAGYETSMAAVARMRDLFVKEADRKEFDDFLRITGAGDHPAFLRLFYHVSKRFDEPAPPSGGHNPPPDRGGKKGEGGRRGAMYDHPTSTKARGA